MDMCSHSIGETRKKKDSVVWKSLQRDHSWEPHTIQENTPQTGAAGGAP